ncbi:MAG: hypothetical protein ABIP67_03165 [Burkholderiales bacterium]
MANQKLLPGCSCLPPAKIIKEIVTGRTAHARILNYTSNASHEHEEFFLSVQRLRMI